VKILLTGFGPFPGVPVNPAEQVVRRLAERARQSGRIQLVTETLPVEYAAATRKLRRRIREERPGAILCLGVAPTRTRLSLERVALNLDDDPQRDNAGVVRRGRKIAPGGPAAYWSTLPLDTLQRALQRRRISASLSNHAGAFLCNHAFYVARQETSRSRRRIPCGFLHVPPMSERGKSHKRGMPLGRMVTAVACCLDVLERTARRKNRN
jgi:pyroglutamyl-peptidase